jgi:hypothetical protein
VKCVYHRRTARGSSNILDRKSLGRTREARRYILIAAESATGVRPLAFCVVDSIVYATERSGLLCGMRSWCCTRVMSMFSTCGCALIQEKFQMS